MTDHEKRVDELVESLGCSIFEAEQILADDKTIDKGGRTEFDLSKEDEKKALKYANVKTKKKPMIPNLTKREKKPKPEKAQIVSTMIESLRAGGAERFEILNEEREFVFYQGETKYKVTLACPRK